MKAKLDTNYKGMNELTLTDKIGECKIFISDLSYDKVEKWLNKTNFPSL